MGPYCDGQGPPKASSSCGDCSVASEHSKPATENSSETSSAQQRGFLYAIGEAVVAFLEPFGVKVDVDVVDKKALSEAAGGPPSGGEAANTQAAEVRGMSLHI